MSWHSSNWWWLGIRVFRFVFKVLQEAMGYEADNGGGPLTDAAKREKDDAKSVTK